MSELPTEISEPQPTGSLVADTRLKWRVEVWDTVVVFGRFRAFIALLGVVGFVAGVAVAWKADSAATLLVTSAVLILAAMLLGPDWERIRAAGGGYELELQRFRDEAVFQAVAQSESFEEFRERVERIEKQLAEAEAAARLADSRSRLAGALAARRARARPTLRPMTGHTFEDGTVQLQLVMPSSGSSGLYKTSCAVTDPEGAVRSADGRAGLPALAGMTSYSVSYPTEFGDPGVALVPGTYEARWRIGPVVPNLFTPPVDIAMHRFTVPEDGNGVEPREAEAGRDDDGAAAPGGG